VLAITPNTKAFICSQFIDFRKGIDGLQGVCRKIIRQDPFSGTIFIFFNKRRTSIRFLFYDGQGFWLCTKRLSKGKFQWFPEDNNGAGMQIRSCDLQALIWNGHPEKANFSKDWREVS